MMMCSPDDMQGALDLDVGTTNNLNDLKHAIMCLQVLSVRQRDAVASLLADRDADAISKCDVDSRPPHLLALAGFATGLLIGLLL